MVILLILIILILLALAGVLFLRKVSPSDAGPAEVQDDEVTSGSEPEDSTGSNEEASSVDPPEIEELKEEVEV